MTVITLCGLHGYTVSYNNSGIPIIITVSFPVVWILNTCEEKLWNSKFAVFLCAIFFSLSKQSSDRTFVILHLHSPALTTLSRVSFWAHSGSFSGFNATTTCSWPDPSGNERAGSIWRVFQILNKFEVLQTREHPVCKLITDMSSAVGENKNLL